MSVRIIVGDALAELRKMPDESVHCCVSSPPYWGLRAYSTEHQIFGGDPACTHTWGGTIPGSNRGGSGTPTDKNGRGEGYGRAEARGSFCACGAWRGELGLEPDYHLYVEHLVEIFREVRRVLRRDGTLWLNLGDCYATGAGKVGERPGGGEQGDRWNGYRGGHKPENAGKAASRVQAMGPMTQPNRMPQPGLKPKDLAMIPARVAIALQDDGWWLRSDIIWDKVNPMPESVTDRPTTSHEHIFLLTRSERYYYDAEAIMEPTSLESHARAKRRRSDHHKWADGGPGDQTIAKVSPSPGRLIQRPPGVNPKAAHAARGTKQNASFSEAITDLVLSRNKRSVWTVATEAYPGAHFATFPPRLIEPCILAGAPPRGVVLDPFLGSGTTLMVADRLGRDGIGIELNPDYAKMAKRRCREPGFAFDLATAPTESKEP